MNGIRTWVSRFWSRLREYWPAATGIPVGITGLINAASIADIFNDIRTVHVSPAMVRVCSWGLVGLSLVWAVVHAWRASRPLAVETRYRAPSADAVQFPRRGQLDRYPVVGAVIEVARSTELSRSLRSGWRLSDVRLEFAGASFASPFPPSTKFSGKNGIKYSLVRDPYVVRDAGTNLELLLAETDYASIRGALDAILSNRDLRHARGSLNPAETQVPHSLCFHYLATTSDGHILATARRSDNPSSWEPGRLSITGEEQLADDDMADEDPVQHWVRRTIAEELFAITDAHSLSAIADCYDLERCRFWGLIFEEPYANFSVVGYLPLRLTVEQYANKVEELRMVTSEEYEGDRWWLKVEDAVRLLKEGRSPITHLATSNVGEATADSMHISSRYRLLLYLKILGRI